LFVLFCASNFIRDSSSSSNVNGSLNTLSKRSLLNLSKSIYFVLLNFTLDVIFMKSFNVIFIF
jgi:hypothetical protein